MPKHIEAIVLKLHKKILKKWEFLTKGGQVNDKEKERAENDFKGRIFQKDPSRWSKKEICAFDQTKLDSVKFEY